MKKIGNILFKCLILIFLLENYVNICHAEAPPKTLNVRLEDISSFSKALNIEGLYKLRGANFHKKGMITAYFTQVLDTPGKIIKNQRNGVELNEKFHASPRGGRMENEIPEFHEERANLFWLIVLQMYLENAHSFTKKDKNKPVFLTIHLHRGKSAISHMAILKKIFVEFFNILPSSIKQKSFKGIPIMEFEVPKKNIHITIQGDNRRTHKIYKASSHPCDIFLAFGFVGALDPSLSSGDVIIPISSFDFNLETLAINIAKEIKGDNHLLQVLSLFLDKYQTPKAITFVNNKLFSPHKPRRKASRYKISDIRALKILAVDEAFFVPSLLQKKCGEKFEKYCVTLTM